VFPKNWVDASCVSSRPAAQDTQDGIKRKTRDRLWKLYPNHSDDQLAEAEENLRRYLEASKGYRLEVK
jgi:hypothetical protein